MLKIFLIFVSLFFITTFANNEDSRDSPDVKLDETYIKLVERTFKPINNDYKETEDNDYKQIKLLEENKKMMKEILEVLKEIKDTVKDIN